VWDGEGHRPPLATDEDWIRAGEIAFDAPLFLGGIGETPLDDLYVRKPDFYEKTGTPVAADGTVPFYRYVVVKKGEFGIGVLQCGMCHSRLMPNGRVQIQSGSG